MRPLPLVLALLIALALAGCIEQPVTSESPPTDPATVLQTRNGDSGFMPMSPGNHWRYDRVLTTVITPEGGPPDPPVVERSHVDVDHVEYRSLGDYEYILEREVYSDEPYASERLRRQDRAGYYLFERPKDEGKTTKRPALSNTLQRTAERVAARRGADPASVARLLAHVDDIRRMLRGLNAAPDTSPPGGPLEVEIQTLAYPLHVGATWTVRDLPLFVATVEAHEQFHGYPAWRVRIETDLLIGDNYSVHVWYSRCGEVGSRVHIEGMVTDDNGTPLGHAVLDDVETIANAQVDRGGCEVVSGGNGGGGGGNGVSSYPLAVGNRWTYEVTTTEHPADGPPVITTVVVDEVQGAWVEIQGRQYIFDSSTPRDGSPVFGEVYLRQDRDGLYQWAGLLGAPKRDRPGIQTTSMLPPLPLAPEEGELTLLVYPLTVGDSWVIADLGTTITATVVARERITVPAGEFDAFQVRIESPFQGPDDESITWCSAEGFVKSYRRVSVGPNTWVEVSRELMELDLVQ